LDWAFLRRQANRHGILPLAQTHLSSLDSGALSAGIPEAWREDARRAAAFNLFLARRLGDLLARLDAAGVSALAYKGPALALEAYGDLGLRPSLDLDLLVRTAQAASARRLLGALGFRPASLEGMPEDVLLRTQCEQAWADPAGALFVDLHWGVAPPSFSAAVDLEGLWRRRRRIPWMGREIALPSPEDLLILLCIHGGKHCWSRLLWVSDVAALAQAHPGLDWAAVEGRASAWGVRRLLDLGPALARDLLGADLPPRTDPALPSLVAEVRRHLFADPAGAPDPLGIFRFHLAARERWRDRARVCLRQGFFPNERDAAWCPPLRPFRRVHALLRPLRLSLAYARRLPDALGGVSLPSGLRGEAIAADGGIS
jgi:hypothetical protein